MPYLYFYRYLPPTAYVAGIVSLVLSPWTAYAAWVIVIELLLLLIVIGILRMTRFPATERRLLAGLWLGFFPFYLEQWMGQFSFLMAAFIWVVLRDGLYDRTPNAPPRGRGFWAWAASVGLKSYTAVFALAYLRRGWWKPVAACAGMVTLVSAPYYIAWPGDLKHFLVTNLSPLPPGVHGGTLGAAAFVRLLSWSLPESIAGILLDFKIFDVYLGNVPVFLATFAVAGASGWATWRGGREAAMPALLSLWTLAFFLIFKDVWEYHYVMLLPVVTALALAHRSRFVISMGLLLAVPTPYILLQNGGHLSHGADLVNHASKALPTIALWIWTLRRIALTGRQDQQATDANAPAAWSDPCG